jgi:hypothetical protein
MAAQRDNATEGDDHRIPRARATVHGALRDLGTQFTAE